MRRGTRYRSQKQPITPQAPPTTPSVSDEETASLHSIISQLKIENATSKTKQKDLQVQLTSLQFNVSSLTTTSSLTSQDPSIAQVLTQFDQFTSVLTKMHSILEKTSSDLPEFAELSALIKSFPPQRAARSSCYKVRFFVFPLSHYGHHPTNFG